MKLRIPPPVIALAGALVMMWLDRHAPILRWIEPPWNRLGWIVMAAGVGIDSLSIASFWRARTTVDPIHVERCSHLVVRGLYRYSRNPMYLGLLALLLGFAILRGSVSPLIVVVAVERLLVLAQIRREEQALEARFGDEYRRYRRAVRRWL